MKVYRITSAPWAGKLTASGFASRWNNEGDYVLYASEHRSLACLENLVHRSGNAYAGEFYITEILIPDSVLTERLPDEVSRRISNSHESLLFTREFGHTWYSSLRSCVLIVPSVVINKEYNFVINTRHPAFSEIIAGSIDPFVLDPRLNAEKK